MNKTNTLSRYAGSVQIAGLALAAAAALTACQTPGRAPDPNAKPEIAVTEGAIRMPVGVDLDRLRLLDQARMTKVYVQVVRIDDAPGNKLLFPPQMARALDLTPSQVTRDFTDTILKSRRFEVYDMRSSVTADQSDIIIDAQVTGATQELKPIEGGLRVAETRVYFSVQMKDIYTGQFLFPAPVAVVGVTGLTSGDRVVLAPSDSLSSAQVQQRLGIDYQRALRRAYAKAAVRIEEVLRPLGRVLSVEDGQIGIIGGQKHGLQADDEMVIFRATTTTLGGREVVASTRAIAVVRCDGVGTETSQCDLVRRAPGQKAQVGDYAVLTDKSLRSDRWE